MWFLSSDRFIWSSVGADQVFQLLYKTVKIYYEREKNGGGDKPLAFWVNGGCNSCAPTSYNTPHYGLSRLRI